MSVYAVTIRGLAEQIVYVKADSRSDAREKARSRDFFDAQEIDFAIDHPVWPTRQPVEELPSGDDQPSKGGGADA